MTTQSSHRVRVAPDRYVPADPGGEPSLCRCKPWHLCHNCGYIEHAGGFCSWCRTHDALEVLANRPDYSRDATRRAKAGRSAIASPEEAA